MIYDLETYRYAVKPIIQSWVNDDRKQSTIDLVNTMAQMTTCPLVVICYLLGEIRGETDQELLDLTHRLESFYKIEEVRGKL